MSAKREADSKGDLPTIKNGENPGNFMIDCGNWMPGLNFSREFQQAICSGMIYDKEKGAMTVKIQEIRSLAKGMGIKSFGRTKVDLIKEIQRQEGNFDCYGTADGYCDQLECIFRDSCLSERK